MEIVKDDFSVQIWIFHSTDRKKVILVNKPETHQIHWGFMKYHSMSVEKKTEICIDVYITMALQSFSKPLGLCKASHLISVGKQEILVSMYVHGELSFMRYLTIPGGFEKHQPLSLGKKSNVYVCSRLLSHWVSQNPLGIHKLQVLYKPPESFWGFAKLQSLHNALESLGLCTHIYTHLSFCTIT